MCILISSEIWITNPKLSLKTLVVHFILCIRSLKQVETSQKEEKKKENSFSNYKCGISILFWATKSWTQPQEWNTLESPLDQQHQRGRQQRRNHGICECLDCGDRAFKQRSHGCQGNGGGCCYPPPRWRFCTSIVEAESISDEAPRSTSMAQSSSSEAESSSSMVKLELDPLSSLSPLVRPHSHLPTTT